MIHGKVRHSLIILTEHLKILPLRQDLGYTVFNFSIEISMSAQYKLTPNSRTQVLETFHSDDYILIHLIRFWLDLFLFLSRFKHDSLLA